jgi:hypothetical protein
LFFLLAQPAGVLGRRADHRGLGELGEEAAEALP